MTTLSHPRRSNADYRWTRDKIMAFLEGLAAGRSVARAARDVGMSRQSAYRMRARLGPGIGAVWDEGVRIGGVRRQLLAARAQAQGRAPAQARPGGAGTEGGVRPDARSVTR